MAVLGFVFINGAFLCGAVVHPVAIGDTMRNPVSLAFMGDALILPALSVYVLHRERVTRVGSGPS